MLALIGVHAKYFSLNALESVDDRVLSFVSYLLVSTFSASCTLHHTTSYTIKKRGKY